MGTMLRQVNPSVLNVTLNYKPFPLFKIQIVYMTEFNGDWFLITGATSGLGYEMATILAKKGKNLVLVSEDEVRLCQVARELNEISDIIIMPVDLTKSGSYSLVSDECLRLGLKISALFNFAM
jgi:short-subunit dehydrogenase